MNGTLEGASRRVADANLCRRYVTYHRAYIYLTRHRTTRKRIGPSQLTVLMLKHVSVRVITECVASTFRWITRQLSF